MELTKPRPRPELPAGKSLTKRYHRYAKLIQTLEDRDLPDSVVEAINAATATLNAEGASDKTLSTPLRKAFSKVLNVLEKECKLVGKNHYQTRWMALGMAAFGMPLGIVFGSAMGNMGLLGMGIPIGMAIGIGVGASMDAKAREEGRQLDYFD